MDGIKLEDCTYMEIVEELAHRALEAKDGRVNEWHIREQIFPPGLYAGGTSAGQMDSKELLEFGDWLTEKIKTWLDNEPHRVYGYAELDLIMAVAAERVSDLTGVDTGKNNLSRHTEMMVAELLVIVVMDYIDKRL